MPRTKLQDKYAPKAPPIDWLRAAMLERQDVMGYNLKQLAEVGGISYSYMRTLSRKSPWDWPKPVLEKVCRELGLKPIYGVEGMPRGEAFR